MNNLYIEKLKMDLFRNADNVNHYAEQKDVNRNHTNYGSASAIAMVLSDFGCKVNLPVWDDNGYLKIPFIQIDEWRIDFYNGK